MLYYTNNMWLLVLQIVLMGVSLAMDAFAVSITDGMCYSKLSKGKAVIIPTVFGIFQAVMPLIGYFLGSLFANYIDDYDHYIAFFLLLIIGGKMIFDGIKDLRSTDGEIKEKKFSFPEVLIQGTATSIDALAVGITLNAMEGVTNTNVFIWVAIIGVVTFVISLVGVILGICVGKLFKNKVSIAEIIGGLVLLGIGLKILIEGIIG